MINHYYGGNISQDRLGYYIRAESDQFALNAPGPERDLVYGKGLKGPLILALLDWALGGVEVTAMNLDDATAAQRDQVWMALTAEIDAGRPVLLVEGIQKGSVHTIVMFGYDIRGRGNDQKRSVLVMDPWHPFSPTAWRGLLNFDLMPLKYYLLITGDVIVNNVMGDPAEMEFDSDRDGINNFDEMNRFGTDPQDPDTDKDCIRDKEEIRLSMFDQKHGYALWFNGLGASDGTARDHDGDDKDADGDMLRAELDNDSDNGGLPDFVEDLNQDGTVEPSMGESNPFDKSDDQRQITGTIFVGRDQLQTSGSRIEQMTMFEHHLQIMDQGRIEGRVDLTYNATHTLPQPAAPPACPDARTILNIFDEVKQQIQVEGQFICVPEAIGPTLVLSEKEPIFSVTLTGTWQDPCFGNRPTRSTLPTVFYVGPRRFDAESNRFFSSTNRVQWKFNAPVREGPGRFEDWDLVMTP